MLGIVNPTHAVSRLDQSEVERVRLVQGRGSANLIISESGLYKLAMRSDKPEARAFQDWVTRDVLPAIRKDGAYIRPTFFRSASLAPR
ncbi:BRO family protein [uncultured Paracoccus sp.]|uniref:BRO-N domain-containing protein n=1 Tax=uncultured Paracoccus sp. TaxID=189685 RepID=UPI00344E5060